MAKLEELTRGAAVKGVLPDGLVTIVDVKWIGNVALELTYKDSAAKLGNELLYRDREPTLEIAQVKEQLLKFDGTPVFPERLAYTVACALSDAEADLYKQVTEYVREEFDRAEALDNEGRKGTVGFALTILQRRLASSPEAILQSIRRRRERLEKRVREEQLLKRGGDVQIANPSTLPVYTLEDLSEMEEFPEEEEEQQVVDQASFKQDKDVQILVATDAAGEGINLQRAHLMVNYDLPWNPNRLEQRFGRIHWQ